MPVWAVVSSRSLTVLLVLDRAAEEEKLARLSAMEAHIRRLERTMGPESPQVYSSLLDIYHMGLRSMYLIYHGRYLAERASPLSRMAPNVHTEMHVHVEKGCDLPMIYLLSAALDVKLYSCGRPHILPCVCHFIVGVSTKTRARHWAPT
jgi:hypothetical protein